MDSSEFGLKSDIQDKIQYLTDTANWPFKNLQSHMHGTDRTTCLLYQNQLRNVNKTKMPQDPDAKKYPGESDEEHPESFVIPPPQPKEKKPGQLTDEQVKEFFEVGYVIVEKFFDPSELQPSRDAIDELVDELANKLYKAGKVKELYKEHGLFHRLIKLNNDFPGANVLLLKLGRLPQAFRDLWSNERLLNVVEQLLGTGDIIGHPVWNLRSKTPKSEEVTVPWHQDAGYLENDAYKCLVPTAWIPLLDANEINGCMQMAKYGHRKGRVATHQCCSGGTWYIMLEESEMEKTLGVNLKDDIVTCPVPYGGLILFSNMIPHRSMDNLSSDIRWSLDLRWYKKGDPTGFYGHKGGVQLRSANDNNFTIDWEPFDCINRHDVAFEDAGVEEREFDTRIPGPWMKKWEIVHINKHVEAFKHEEQGEPITEPILTC